MENSTTLQENYRSTQMSLPCRGDGTARSDGDDLEHVRGCTNWGGVSFELHGVQELLHAVMPFCISSGKAEAMRDAS